MNREKEKFLAEALGKIGVSLNYIIKATPDYDIRKIHLTNIKDTLDTIKPCLEADLEGEDKAPEAPAEPEKKKKAASKKKAEPVAPEAPAQEPQPEPEAPTVTLAEVRGVLARKSEEGKGDAVKALIAEFKAAKLSEVDPQFYANLIARGEEL